MNSNRCQSTLGEARSFSTTLNKQHRVNVSSEKTFKHEIRFVNMLCTIVAYHTRFKDLTHIFIQVWVRLWKWAGCKGRGATQHQILPLWISEMGGKVCLRRDRRVLCGLPQSGQLSQSLPTPFHSSPSSSTQSPSLNPTFLLPRHPISLLELTQTLTTWEMLLLLCHSLLLIFAQQVRRALPFHLFFPQTADKTTLDATQKLLYINPEEST